MSSENPFFVRSDLPYRLPPFDRISTDHYLPAFEHGMAEQRAEVDAIAEDPAPPTFENTIVALERSGELLDRVAVVFDNATSAGSTPEIQRLEAEIAPRRAAHRDAIVLDRRLYERIRTLYDARAGLDLDPESQWLLARYHLDFVRAGATLADADADRLRELNRELSTLTARFGTNLLADTNDLAVVVTDRAELDGLSEDAIAAAARSAKERGLEDGSYVIDLRLPTAQPALDALTDRGLRERIHRASISRGLRGNANDNSETVRRIVALRAQQAQLLGYRSHAAYVIEDTTAGSPEAVSEMLGRIVPAAVANARAEATARAELNDGEPLQPWDWALRSEQLRKAEYDLDSAALRPYFELERVLFDGVLFAATGLYGIEFTERHDLPVPFPGGRVFEVTDADGSALGLFLADLYTRDTKRGGAWCSSFVRQSALRGTLPVPQVNMNLDQPPAGEPTLLTFDEVRTLFHEFGHALHVLFSDVTYPRFSGTSVPRDFVEYPSQVNEMWVLWPEVLANYAKHVDTGEPLPQAIVDKLHAASAFNEGFKTTEYLAATLLDQAWHRLDSTAAAEVGDDVAAFEADALVEAGVAVAEVPPRYRTTYFSHAFGGPGYSGRYYSYIWSEVLDADTVEWFIENGGLTRENGDHFRATLLSVGGSVDSMAAYRAFRGRDPEIEPLLVRRGLRR